MGEHSATPLFMTVSIYARPGRRRWTPCIRPHKLQIFRCLQWVNAARIYWCLRFQPPLCVMFYDKHILYQKGRVKVLAAWTSIYASKPASVHVLIYSDVTYIRNKTPVHREQENVANERGRDGTIARQPARVGVARRWLARRTRSGWISLAEHGAVARG